MRLFLLNTSIVILALICLTFIFSAVHRHWRGGTSVEYLLSSPETLLIDYREESSLPAIEVEVLNGCGVFGLAQQFTDYLRTHQIDVIRTENADHYEYENTLILQRNEFIESSYRIAELLDISKGDTARILIKPDLSLETDVTLIIGRDYGQIKPLRDFLEKLP